MMAAKCRRASVSVVLIMFFVAFATVMMLLMVMVLLVCAAVFLPFNLHFELSQFLVKFVHVRFLI
jgi:hypothetical protein